MEGKLETDSHDIFILIIIYLPFPSAGSLLTLNKRVVTLLLQIPNSLLWVHFPVASESVLDTIDSHQSFYSPLRSLLRIPFCFEFPPLCNFGFHQSCLRFSRKWFYNLLDSPVWISYWLLVTKVFWPSGASLGHRRLRLKWDVWSGLRYIEAFGELGKSSSSSPTSQSLLHPSIHPAFSSPISIPYTFCCCCCDRLPRFLFHID